MIFTFYSYKGGVGRSMALANVAELFYQVGLKVLMVDWDLEAPGLERFFPIDADDILGKPGVIDLLLDYKQQMSQDMLNLKGGDKLPFQRPTELMTNIYPNASEKGKLYLLTAGKRANKHFEKYANTVLTFDWQDFYQNWEGGLYFDWLRQQFEEVADVILIDSRTGITEMGGICTYHLADVIVMFCTPSQQCMNGTYKMAQNFISSKVKKLRGERRLDILVIPARIERAESSLMDNFQQEFLNKFKTFIPNKKLTENIDDIAQKLWETLRIPYVPKYAYNEILAVREGELDSAIDISEAFLNLKQEMIRLRIYQLAEMLVELNFQKHKSELKYSLHH